jgi:hypothetical protein
LRLTAKPPAPSVADMNFTRHLTITAAATFTIMARGAVVIDPKRKLREHTTYRVVLTSRIRDLAGNPLVGATWRFTTR